MAVEPGLTALAVTPLSREFGAEGADETGHPGLGRAVGGQHGQAPGGGGRGHGQEPAVARFGVTQQRGHGHPGQVDDAAEVDVEHGLFLAGRQLPGWDAARDDAGHGQGRVQVAPPVFGGGDGGGPAPPRRGRRPGR